MLEIIAKANNIIRRLKLTNEDGEINIIYPSKLTIKQMKYNRADGTEAATPAYFFVLSKELIEYLNIKKYVYFYMKNERVFISPVEPEEYSRRVKLNSRRQVLVPKEFFNVEDKRAAVVLLNMQEDHPYVQGCGAVSVELI